MSIDNKSPEINGTIIDNRHQTEPSQPNNDTDKQPDLTDKIEKNGVKPIIRNIEHGKIQSDTKDILNHSGDNIVQPKKVVTSTTVAPPNIRTTSAKTFSNSGGNGGTLDDVQTLTADSVTRKRHRRRRQGR